MKFRFKGLQEYVNKLEALNNYATQHIAMEEAVKKGSKVVSDKQYEALINLKVDNRPYVPGQRDGILEIQKRGLIKSFGTSETQIKRNDFINKKTGIAKGENKLGQLNTTIARRLEYGCSFMPKNAIFSKAARNSRQKCIDAMQESLNESYKKIFN